MKRTPLVCLLAIALMTLQTGFPQTLNPKIYVGEIVMDRYGQLVPPWRETRGCLTKAATECKAAVINTATREIARYDNKWSSKFEPTGNGKEVRRAETAIAKATRLKGARPK